MGRFFFFQAEDGIRDVAVTGVQTCALPICQNRLNCRGDVDPAASLWEQARAMAVRVHSSNTQWGYVEKSDFLRFRELSLTFTLPDQVARWMNAKRVSLTASGRNLKLITGYSGADPQ